MITVLWEFRVRPERRTDFEREYGQKGIWVRLFSNDPAYGGTTLVRDLETPGRYVAQDRWRDLDSYVAFKKCWKQDYERIDKECGAFTLEERYLGAFEVVE